MSKNVKTTGKVLVIQLGREETKLVLLQNGSDVLYSTVLTTPIGAVEDGMIQNQDAVRFMLKEALKDPELKRVRKVIFALCTSQAITEVVTTPDVPDAKLGRLVVANADMYFPLDVHDYQLAWKVIGPKTSDTSLKELNVQLWAIPNGMLSPYYTVANACGLSVLAIDYCGHSIATAVGASFAEAAGAEKKTKQKLSLNMEISFGKKKEVKEEAAAPRAEGAVHTDMHILLEKDILGLTCVQRNQVVFQRFIRCGSSPAYQLTELAMMVDYFMATEAGRGSSAVGILSGSQASDPALAGELADMLGISLGLLDIPCDLNLVCCIGAGRTDMDFGIPILNKPSKARKEMQTNLWQYALILVGGLMLLSSVFSLLTARLTWSSNLTLMQTQIQLLQAENKKYDGYADNYESYISAYNAYSSDWDSVYANLQTNNDNLVLVLDELEQLMPEKASITDMQIGATGMYVTFATENKEQAAYIIMALRDMKYASLPENGVSSLVGGGAGPAKTYGTGRDDKEQAPVEGGTDISTADRQRLTESLAADMKPYDLAFYMGMGNKTPDVLGEMYEVYGVQLKSTDEEIDDLGASYAQRKAAFETMCTTNPFAMRAAIDMMRAEYPGGEIFNYIKEYEFSKYTTHRNPSGLEKNLNGVLDLIFWNDNYDETEIFPVVEDIIRRNPEAELWYIYYVKGEMAEQNPMPCLNLSKMVDDLLDGQLDSGNDTIDQILNGMLSGDTREILDEIRQGDEVPTDPSETQPGETEPSSSETEPSSSETLPPLPTASDDPFATTDPSETEPSSSETEPTETEPTVTEPTETEPTVTEPTETEPSETEPSETEPSETDPSETEPSETEPSETEPSETDPSVTDPSETDPSETDPSETDPSETDPSETDPSETDPSEPDMGEMMDKLGTVMENYLATGTTGLTDAEELLVEAALQQYMPGMTLERVLEDQLENYFTNGYSDYEQFDQIIGDYLEKNPDKEAELTDKYTVTIELALKEYLKYGSTNFEEGLIKQYLRDGTTKVAEYTEKLDKYVKDGKVDAELTTLLLKDRETLNNTLKTMMENYDKGEGNQVINAQLKICKKAYEENVLAMIDRVQDLLGKYLKNGGATGDDYDVVVEAYLRGELKKYEDYAEINDALDKYVKDGKVDAQLKNLIRAYSKNPNSISSKAIITMFGNYYGAGDTGSKALNGRIRDLEKELLDELVKLSQEKNSGGSYQGPKDTRIFFTVVLAYNNELKLAELERKGLDYEEKIALIKEVGEE